MPALSSIRVENSRPHPLPYARFVAVLLNTRNDSSWPDASNAATGTAVVRVPAPAEKVVGERQLSYRSCGSRVFGQQPADRLVKKWQIHTPPNTVAGQVSMRAGGRRRGPPEHLTNQTHTFFARIWPHSARSDRPVGDFGSGPEADFRGRCPIALICQQSFASPLGILVR